MIPLLLVVVALSKGFPATAEFPPILLDPRTPAFVERTDLMDTLSPTLNEVRGRNPDFHRVARRGAGSKPLPCAAASTKPGKKGRKTDRNGTGKKSGSARLVRDGRMSVCLELQENQLRLTTKGAASDSVIRWIPVFVSQQARVSLVSARIVRLSGEPLLEMLLVERNDPADGGRFEDTTWLLVDPVRERWLVNARRSHQAEGGSDQGNFTESCEAVAEIREGLVVLGGETCDEETLSESDSGEESTYTRHSGPEPVSRYRFRRGLLAEQLP